MRSRMALGAGMLLGIATASLAGDCPPPTGSVRVMMHDPEVLSARLSLLTQAGDDPAARARAVRTLFEAAGCTAIAERGDSERHNVECIVRGRDEETIVVGASQEFDSVATLALLPSLMEALSAAPRAHTFRWVAFSAHKDRRPKGAMRFLDAAPHDTLRAMVHLGPLGFGPLKVHVGRGQDKLDCLLTAAAARTGVRVDQAGRDLALCRQRVGHNPLAARSSGGQFEYECSGQIQERLGNDWTPFRAAGIPVFGVRSGDLTRPAVPLDPEEYVRSERAVAIFLALADDALAAPATSSPR